MQFNWATAWYVVATAFSIAYIISWIAGEPDYHLLILGLLCGIIARQEED